MGWLIVCLPAILIIGAVYALREHEIGEDENIWKEEYKRVPPPYYEDEK